MAIRSLHGQWQGSMLRGQGGNGCDTTVNSTAEHAWQIHQTLAWLVRLIEADIAGAPVQRFFRQEQGKCRLWVTAQNQSHTVLKKQADIKTADL